MKAKPNFFVVYPRKYQDATNRIMQDISIMLGVDCNIWSYDNVRIETDYYTKVVVPAIEKADFVLIFIEPSSHDDYIVRESALLCQNLNKSIIPIKYGSIKIDEKYWNFRSKIINIYDENQKDALAEKMRSWMGMIVVDGGACIDLGLPSKILWASCNIGAKSPKENGNYYSWTDSDSREYSRDKNMVVAPQYSDPATDNWCAGWRLPTKDEFNELLQTCKWQWIDKGYKVTGPNGNSIFFPSAGFCEKSVSDKNGLGYYWTQTLLPYDPRQKYFLYFNYNTLRFFSLDSKRYGMSIRAVYSNKSPRPYTDGKKSVSSNVGGKIWFRRIIIVVVVCVILTVLLLFLCL